MIVIVYKSKILVEKRILEINDPLTKENGVDFVITQRYAELFLLPFLPVSKKKVTAYSITTDEPIPIQLWTSEMKQKADVIKSDAKGTWKLFMLWYVLFVLFSVVFIYTRTEMHLKNKDRNKQTEYFSNPKIGDIAYCRTYPSVGNPYISPFKIIAERGDSLLVMPSDERKPFSNKFLDESKLVGEFNISTSQFAGDTLVYQKKFYSGRHFLPFPPKKKSSSDLSSDSKSDLIEIMYIERPD